MTGFNHGMNGAVIALLVKNPAIALPLSFASHYLADLVPHFGFKQDKVLGKSFNRYLAGDFILSVVLMVILALLFPDKKFLIWACMAVSAAPDMVWWLYRKTVKDWPKGLDKFSAWHFKVNNDIAHVAHGYYDAVWFVGTWLIVLIIWSR